MRKKSLLTSLFLAAGLFTYAQDSCSFGTISDTTSNGENISTGGDFEYAGAVDFDIPLGTDFTANQITINLLKGPADLQYVNASFINEMGGLPGDTIQSFENLLPSSQVLAYVTGIENLDVYEITLDLPNSIVLEKGKYFLGVSAAAGDENGAWWEITSEQQTYGVFDYSKFEDEGWGGTGYYNKVFQIIGSCEDSGEQLPDYGDVCEQGNASNDHEDGISFLAGQQVVSITDDFIVAENTQFFLSGFKMHALLLAAGLDNATIKIRSSNEQGMPGEVLHTYENKSPMYEAYNDYWPFPGYPLDVVAVEIGFAFDPVVQLEAGTYFVEVLPTPAPFTEFLVWELTSSEGTGGYSYSSTDGGTTWNLNDGVNQVFSVEGYCSPTVGVENPDENISLQYYPNPVKDVLYISSDTRIGTVEIYNIAGQKLAQYNSFTGSVDMANFAEGMYLLKVTFANQQSRVIKFLKEF